MNSKEQRSDFWILLDERRRKAETERRIRAVWFALYLGLATGDSEFYSHRIEGIAKGWH
jgi:hypothetical protein